MEQRLSVVTLAVPEVGASVDFYRRAFGWEPAAVVEEEVAFFDLGSLVLSLWSGLSEELGRESNPPPGATALAHNVRSPEEVDRIVAEAVAEGASLPAPPRAQPWGGYSGVLADPDGHLWEIAYNPDWPLDADGRLVLPW